ncbi:FAD-dependent oxidoreductase [Sinimarinibacterium sp. CAU 1509]|uniref:NAD(P)-binding protein n=1 Tax=Sinimarinibacterium sp. CAU 1509 TaxID=2562283 RepID=UPI0010ABB92A|nr:NAD(P)-binding protein [Sinimarinibacterium sp. CAU 1509]TJY59042.1 FAD-dependent oxidoreductase [Sinimarinibacterium sp. CAU 1509]
MKQYPRGGIAEPGASLAYHTGSWRVQRPVHVHQAAPCHHACPAGEDAQAYLALVEQGAMQAAWEALVSANPLPAITGRVCPHPCESGCNRGQYDEPVSIHGIERVLGDEAIRNNWAYPVSAPAADAPTVAVIGAGPAGLSCAWHLLRRGLRVVVFESETEPGGICATAIPEYRLPAKVVSAECGRLLALDGIEFQPGQQLGRDVSLHDLKQQYAAVFIGAGAQQARPWNIDGVTPVDLHDGLAVLKEWTRVGQVPPAARVAVIGGGNTAVDLCRVFKRAGASQVMLVTHSGMPGPGVPDAMRALPRELEQAQEEGVEILAHRGVRRLVLRGEKVAGLETVHMKKLPDANGRLRRVAFEGTESLIHVDMVVPATGQDVDGTGFEELLNGQTYLSANAEGATGADRVFAGGDVTGQAGTVAAAVGQGRRAAAAIARALGKTAETPRRSEAVVAFSALNTEYFEAGKRHHGSSLPVAERGIEREVEQGLGLSEARAEAGRCLSCGNCLACDNCYTLCPDTAVLKTRAEAADGSHYVFDYEYCKGCGLCANECPTGYIQMVPEL